MVMGTTGTSKHKCNASYDAYIGNPTKHTSNASSQLRRWTPQRRLVASRFCRAWAKNIWWAQVLSRSPSLIRLGMVVFAQPLKNRYFAESAWKERALHTSKAWSRGYPSRMQCSSFQGPQALQGSVWSYLPEHLKIDILLSPLEKNEHCIRPGRKAIPAICSALLFKVRKPYKARYCRTCPTLKNRYFTESVWKERALHKAWSRGYPSHMQCFSFQGPQAL